MCACVCVGGGGVSCEGTQARACWTTSQCDVLVTQCDEDGVDEDGGVELVHCLVGRAPNCLG